jgi:hypothetical protein
MAPLSEIASWRIPRLSGLEKFISNLKTRNCDVQAFYCVTEVRNDRFQNRWGKNLEQINSDSNFDFSTDRNA